MLKISYYFSSLLEYTLFSTIVNFILSPLRDKLSYIREMNDFFDFMVSTYTGAFIFMFIGGIGILIAIKSPELKKSAFRGDLHGWIGGVSLIIIGILVVISKVFEVL